MNSNSLNFVINVLKCEKPVSEPDWYETLGFLMLHRIGGLFYNKARKLQIKIPNKIEKILYEIFEKQKSRNQEMQKHLKELSQALLGNDINCIVLKGGAFPFVFAGLYEEGERVSNDIDLLVNNDSVSRVASVLKKLGYVQGRYCREKAEIEKFNRQEIIKRKLNRGETAPFIKKCDNISFLEIDVNFSLGNLPNEYKKLQCDMLENSSVYIEEYMLRAADREMFFIHLILHQYKESTLYFSVSCQKDLDLYKLTDIYYIFKSGLLDLRRVETIVFNYGIGVEFSTVLIQVGEIFNCDRMIEYALHFGKLNNEVIDYDKKKRYKWIADSKSRVMCFNNLLLLRECIDDN